MLMARNIHRILPGLFSSLLAIMLVATAAYGEGPPAPPVEREGRSGTVGKHPGQGTPPGNIGPHHRPGRGGALNAPGHRPGWRGSMKNGPHPVRPSAPRHRRVVTPYGDFCPRCTTYGMGKKVVGMDNATEALRSYFNNKGMNIRNIKGQGRFLKADVFRDGELVDKILFDRRTGRIRSIY